MRKFSAYHVICMGLILASAGWVFCAQSNPHAPRGATSAAAANDPGKVVMKVGSVQVTESEFDKLLGSMSPQQLEQNGGRHAIGETYSNMLVLSQAAKSQHLDSSPQFRQQMDLERNNLLARMESQDIARKLEVTSDEVSRYFTAHQPEFKEAKVYEVEVLKKSARNANGLAEAEAQAKTSAIRKALSSGTDIKAVAKTYNVPNQVVVVSDPQPIAYKPSLPEFVRAAFTLPAGALSQVQDSPDAILFVQVASHDTLTLKDATPQIENAIRQQKFENALNGLRKQYPVWMDSSYFGSTGAPHLGEVH
ncbi:MAG: peptidyl-prolyl cis-trans isomerase [Terriglobia bacterium]